MAERDHFSNDTLRRAEKFQSKLVSPLGKSIVKALTGSSSPAYVQLGFSSDVHARRIDFSYTAKARGNRSVLPLTPPRFWSTAAILQASTEAVDKLVNNDDEIYESFAYHAGKRWHIGIPDSRKGLFERDDDRGTVSLAARIGRGPLRATLGIYNATNDSFNYVKTRISEAPIQILDISIEHPGLRLV